MALAKDFQTALAAKATFSRPLKPIGLLADGCLVKTIGLGEFSHITHSFDVGYV